MSSVVTPRIWVSPRSNSALPCARGTTDTSAESARMSVMPRPSMRKWSVRMRCRTSFFVSERNAAEISFSRPPYVSASRWSTSARISSVRSLRSALPAMVSALVSSSVATEETA